MGNRMHAGCRTALKYLAILAALSIGTAGLSRSAAAEEKLTIFAAASLKTALDAINSAWQAETGKEITTSYAASSALAKQIEAGAPADIFMSADLAWMDYLSGKSLVRQDTRSNLLGNRLVLITGIKDAGAVGIHPDFDLKGLLGDGKLAMGAVQSVPAGKYGKAALEKLGAWPSVEGSVAGAENVRAALLLVARGEAPYGIVYQTDAAAEDSVKIVGTFPENSHPPIIYPVAMTADSDNANAGGYIAFLKSAKAAALFEAQGFTILK